MYIRYDAELAPGEQLKNTRARCSVEKSKSKYNWTESCRFVQYAPYGLYIYSVYIHTNTHKPRKTTRESLLCIALYPQERTTAADATRGCGTIIYFTRRNKSARVYLRAAIITRARFAQRRRHHLKPIIIRERAAPLCAELSSVCCGP